MDSMVRTLVGMFGWNDEDALQNAQVMFPTFGDSTSLEQHLAAAAAITSSLLQSRGLDFSSPFGGAGVRDILTAAPQSQSFSGTSAAKSITNLGHGSSGDEEVMHQIQEAQRQLQHQQLQASQEQQARRGRPCKQPGKWSKGYLATKRYRQKKKDQVQTMEFEVLKKMEQLHQMQLERQQLQQKEQLLQNTLNLLESTLPDLAQLDMGLECKSSCSRPAGAEAEAANSVSAGAEQQAACSQGSWEDIKRSGSIGSQQQQQQQQDGPGCIATNSDGNSNGASQSDWVWRFDTLQQAAAAATMEQQRRQPQQQTPDVPALLHKYKEYVTDAAARLAAMAALEVRLGQQQQQQQLPVAEGHLPQQCLSQQLPQQTSLSQQFMWQQQQQQGSACDAGLMPSMLSAAATDATGFPRFPLNVVEALAMWKLIGISSSLPANKDSPASSYNSQEEWGTADATLATTAAAASAPLERSNSQPRTDMLVLNLETGEHCQISEGFWAKVAEQVPLRPEQTQQLEAALKLMVSALEKINQERRELARQLQAAADGLWGSDAALCTAETQPAAAAAASEENSGGPVRGPRARSAGHAVDYCFALSDDVQRHLQLADAVEANLLRGRAVTLMYGWSMKASFDNEQFARMCVASWPHFPLMRVIVAHMLRRREVQASVAPPA